MARNHFLLKKCIFSENPCRFLRTMQKSEKTIRFYVKNCKKEQFCFILLMFFAFLTRGTLRNPFSSRRPE